MNSPWQSHLLGADARGRARSIGVSSGQKSAPENVIDWLKCLAYQLRQLRDIHRNPPGLHREKRRKSSAGCFVKRSAKLFGKGARLRLVGTMEQYLIRFFTGGLMVSAFAAVGDVVRPKSFAGLFGAAPSIAIATLLIGFGRPRARFIFGGRVRPAYHLQRPAGAEKGDYGGNAWVRRPY
jgi:hypothetical protein